MESSGPRMAPGWPRAAGDAARPAHKALLCLLEKGPTPPPPSSRLCAPALRLCFRFPRSLLIPCLLSGDSSHIYLRGGLERASPGTERGQTKGDFCLKELLFFPLPEIRASLEQKGDVRRGYRLNPQPLWVCRPRPSLCCLLVLQGPSKHRGNSGL